MLRLSHKCHVADCIKNPKLIMLYYIKKKQLIHYVMFELQISLNITSIFYTIRNVSFGFLDFCVPYGHGLLDT